MKIKQINIRVIFQSVKDIPFQVLLLILIVLLVYCNSLFNGFTFEDKTVIKNSELLNKNLSVISIFTKDYYKDSQENSYQPVVTLSYWLESKIFGIKPAFMHLTNIILHMLNVLLIYLWFEKQTDKWAAFSGAAIFGIHPVLSESVNSIAFREYLLTAFFLLLTLRNFLNNEIKPSKTRFLFVGIFALFAMFSHPSGLLVLPLLFITDSFFLNKEKIASRIPIYIYLLCVSIFYIMIISLVLKNPMQFPPNRYFGGSFFSSFVSIPKLLLIYFTITIFPFQLRPDWMLNPVKLPADPFFWAGMLLIIILFHFTNKKNGLYLWAFWWFIISMLPVLNITPRSIPFAERYLYIALIAPFSILCIWIKEKNHLSLLWQMIAVILILYSIRTISRNADWKNNMSLFKSATQYKCTEKSWYELGNAYLLANDTVQTELALLKALEINPTFREGYYVLGNFYLSQGKKTAADECFKKYSQLKY